MLSRFITPTGLIAAAVVAAACGSSGGGGPYAAGPSASPSIESSPPVAASPSPVGSPQSKGITIEVGSTRVGKILVGPSGRTIYLFLADSRTSSACNSAGCVEAWPPVLTTGAPKAGAGVNPSLLGTLKRRDGNVEVTYAGHPLYYFISDRKPGDLTGQGVDAFGAPWYVVAPSGAQIDD
jgi:predicted lipoprotein with Yx(FWY)xxD motif